MRVKESLRKFWDLADDKKRVERFNQELGEQEAEIRAQETTRRTQRQVEHPRIVNDAAVFAGRIMIVAQFQGYQAHADKLAEEFNKLVDVPTKVVGISTHVSAKKSVSGPKGNTDIYGKTPFINSANALDMAMRRFGYAVNRQDYVGFSEAEQGRLGLSTIIEAALDTSRNFAHDPSKVAQIAVVSGLGFPEVGLEYDSDGASYLLQEDDDNGELSWKKVSDHIKLDL